MVCQSCSKLKLHLPRDFHIRLLASTLHFLKTFERNKGTFKDAARNEKESNGIRNGMLETTKVDRMHESEDIAEEGYGLVVSLLGGCDVALLPELLEGLCGEIVSDIP